MPVSSNLKHLIELNAPLWAAEAEIARTYWNWDKRSKETDIKWLRNQCYKEFAGIGDSEGTTIAMISALHHKLFDWAPNCDTKVDRHEIEEYLETVYTEFTHYIMLADIHDKLVGPGGPKMVGNELKPWPEEKALGDYRIKITKEFGELGMRAMQFTEGGYCTVYSEGAKLRGRGGVDEMIGNACQKIYDDEFGHMMKGIIGIDDAGLSGDDWKTLETLTMEQLKMRIYMRNAMFSHPLSDQRIKEIFDGKIEPIQFDYAKAEAYEQEMIAA